MDTTNTAQTGPTNVDTPLALPTATPPASEQDQSILLHGISWEQYVGIVDLMGERRFRHTYNDGTLEIMSPSLNHDWEQYILARLLERMTEELEIPIKGIGSTTQRPAPPRNGHRRKGIEPDECYYIANAQAMQGRGLRGDKLDFAKDPPPDLAIEIDVTSSSEPRLPIFAAIGIGEVWRLDAQGLRFLQLVDSEYREVPHSPAFPFLPAKVLEGFVGSGDMKDDLEIV